MHSRCNLQELSYEQQANQNSGPGPSNHDQTNQRPDLVPGVPLTLPGAGRNGVPLVNPAAFAAPPLDANGNFLRFGDAGNGILRALNSWQIDMALMKDTKLTERLSVEFGVQVFNILNHVQLGDPNNLALNFSQGVDASGNLIANNYFLTTKSDFGVITSTNNFNTNNDNAASPNTGTGLPRQIQFMLRIKF